MKIKSEELKMRKITTYEVVSLTALKKGICPYCSKASTRSKTIQQTLSPYNRNVDKSLKTKGQIIVELNNDLKKWKSQPCYHAKCEEIATLMSSKIVQL